MYFVHGILQCSPVPHIHKYVPRTCRIVRAVGQISALIILITLHPLCEPDVSGYWVLLCISVFFSIIIYLLHNLDPSVYLISFLVFSLSLIYPFKLHFFVIVFVHAPWSFDLWLVLVSPQLHSKLRQATDKQIDCVGL